MGKKIRNRHCLKIVIALMIAGVAALYAQSDYIEPNILHQPLEKHYEGQDLVIEAIVTDNIAVQEVFLFYRSIGESNYKYLEMFLEFNAFAVEIPQEEITSTGIEYYIQASDPDGNLATAPRRRASENPYRIAYISASATTPPDMLLISPAPGEVLEDGNQVIIISLYDREDDVNVFSASLLIDGEDVTKNAVVTQDLISYIPAVNFSDGEHSIEFSIADRTGNKSISGRWSFWVSEKRVEKTFWADAQIQGTFDTESYYNKFYGKEQPENRPLDTEKSRLNLSFNRDWFKSSLTVALNTHVNQDARDYDNRRQPLNRYRFMVKVPYVTVQGGDQNPYFSELTLKGARIRGLVTSVTTNSFKAMLISGETKKKIPGITTGALDSLQHDKGTLRRKVTGVSASFNLKDYWEIGVNYLEAQDDTASFSDNYFDSFGEVTEAFPTRYQAPQNRTAGINTRLRFWANHIDLLAYWAVSSYTDDSSLPGDLQTTITTYDKDRSLDQNIVEGTYWLEMNTSFKRFDVKALMRRVPRNFTSLGNPSLQTDILSKKIDTRIKFWEDRITMGLGYEDRRDNLDEIDKQTTNIDAYNGQLSLSGIGGMGFTLGYRLMQRNGSPVVIDTAMALAEDYSSTISIGPTYNFTLRDVKIGVAGNIMLMGFNDDANPDANFTNNSYMLTVSQLYPSALSVNVGFGISENVPNAGEKTLFSILNSKIAYPFLDNRLKLFLNLGLINGNKKNEINNQKLTAAIGGQWKFLENHFIGFDFGRVAVDDFLDPLNDYSEARARIKYKYKF